MVYSDLPVVRDMVAAPPFQAAAGSGLVSATGTARTGSCTNAWGGPPGGKNLSLSIPNIAVGSRRRTRRGVFFQDSKLCWRADPCPLLLFDRVGLVNR